MNANFTFTAYRKIQDAVRLLTKNAKQRNDKSDNEKATQSAKYTHHDPLVVFRFVFFFFVK